MATDHTASLPATALKSKFQQRLKEGGFGPNAVIDELIASCNACVESLPPHGKIIGFILLDIFQMLKEIENQYFDENHPWDLLKKELHQAIQSIDGDLPPEITVRHAAALVDCAWKLGKYI